MNQDGVNKLVRMANQIAENFDYGDRDKAVAGVLDHLMRFWTMEMKQSLIERHQAGKTALNEIAADAVDGLAEKIGQAA